MNMIQQPPNFKPCKPVGQIFANKNCSISECPGICSLQIAFTPFNTAALRLQWCPELVGDKKINIAINPSKTGVVHGCFDFYRLFLFHGIELYQMFRKYACVTLRYILQAIEDTC